MTAAGIRVWGVSVLAVIAGSCGAPARAPAPADPHGAIEQRRSALTTDVAVTVVDGWGNPVAAQLIEAVDPGDNVVNSGPTDAAGHVSLAVDDGTYVFRTTYHFASFQSAACDVSSGCTSATVQIEKPVQVAVTDGYSGAVTGQAVTAINDEGKSHGGRPTVRASRRSIFPRPGRTCSERSPGTCTSTVPRPRAAKFRAV